jgi:hypothetical protein
MIEIAKQAKEAKLPERKPAAAPAAPAPGEVPEGGEKKMEPK